MYFHERVFGLNLGGIDEVSLERVSTEVRRLVSRALTEFAIVENPTSKLLQLAIKKELEIWGAEIDFRFQPVAEKAQANFEIDFLKRIEFAEHTLLVAGELAFDNRQALPTNILKVDLALRRIRAASSHDKTVSVLITFCDETRHFAAWDGSVASYEEYEKQLAWGWNLYLTAPLLVLGFHSQATVGEGDAAIKKDLTQS